MKFSFVFIDTKQEQSPTTSTDLNQMKKFPDDLVYAYLCEVSV